jgi:hypothetical protein
MTVRPRFVVPGAIAIASACLVAACGSYDNKPGAGGAGGSGATAGSGGASGGTGGATGGAAGVTGGSSGSGGASGSGGSAGATGGSSGSAGATGGSSAGQAGSGAGGVPMAGASGSGGDAGMGGAAGGGGGAAACTEAAACGGDVVGTWMVSGCGLTLGGMANLVPAGIGCTEAPIMGSVTVSGTWTATADGMFTDNTTTVGQATLELAPECLMISGFAAECDRINLDSGGLLNTVCVDNTQTMGCTCTVPIDQSGGLAAVSYEGSVDAASSGTYTAADNKVTTSVPSSSPGGVLETEYAYCVASTTLTMTVSTQTNAGVVTGPIVFQKQ